jgi:Mg/Co/Ni transporter MgtE
MKIKKVSRFANVARIVETDVPVINVKAMVGNARRTLQEHSYKSADLILLPDEQGHLAGVVETIKLLAISDDIPVASCRHRELPIVSPLLDQEHAAELAAQHGVSILVIVDR